MMQILKILIPVLFFPFLAFSQVLPDSVLMKKTGVKKLLVLKCEEGFPTDTEYVWMPGANYLAPENFIPDTSFASRERTTTNDGDFLLFRLNKTSHCPNDTIGFGYRFDRNGRLAEQVSYSCEKGNCRKRFFYDENGRLITCIYTPRPDIPVTREEYTYDSLGRLSAVTSWWALHPERPERDSSDDRMARIEYHYGKNGLITEAIAIDRLRQCYAASDWGHLADWFSEEGTHWPEQVTFKYVYGY